MTAFKTLTICVALSTTLAACVAPSQPLLDNARIVCASGNTEACGAVPSLQAQVYAEQQHQSAAAAGVLVGLAQLALLGLAISKF